MTCNTCGEKPKDTAKDFTKAVIEINNPEALVLLRKVVIPASMGTEEDVPAAIGKYRNVILYYEANKHTYLYSSDGIPTLLETDVPQAILDSIENLEEGLENLDVELEDLKQDFEDFKNSPDVVDIVPTYAALQAYDTSKLGDNDIIRVLQDETHDDNSTYYRWDSQTETWTYVGEIDLSSATFFYADPDETGDTRHIYKDETFTEAATIQDVLDAEAKGQVILRKITNSSVPRRLRYEDSYLTRVNIADPTRPNPYCWLYFLGYDSYHDYLGYSLSDSSFTYTEHEFQGKLTAGSNITISGDTISATDTTYSNFTGTDGQTAGTSGLVPAPATTDVDKFLKADGTWDTAAGGSITTLTEDDYNWNSTTQTATEPYNCVALWLLDPGLYKCASGIIVRTSAAAFGVGDDSFVYLIGGTSDFVGKAIIEIYPTYSSGLGYSYGSLIAVRTNGSEQNRTPFNSVVDSLTANYPRRALSAAQGKVLNERIGNLSNLTTTAKTNLVAAINEVAGSGGGSSIITLTEDDYNWNSTTSSATEPYDCVGLWLLPDGFYSTGNLSTSQFKIGGSGDDGGNLGNYGVFLKCQGQNRITIFGFVKEGVNNANTLEGIRQWQIVSSTNTIEWYKYVLMSNNLLNSTGNNEYGAITQNAATSMVFQDPSTKRTIQIGDGAVSIGYSESVAIGRNAKANGDESVCIGKGAGIGTPSSVDQFVAIGLAAGQNMSNIKGCVSLGAFSKATRTGEVNIGSTDTNYGYNSTNYRVLGGVHDPVDDHDAATKGYVDTNMPVITMTSTDPGEGATLAANNFIGVYQ